MKWRQPGFIPRPVENNGLRKLVCQRWRKYSTKKWCWTKIAIRFLYVSTVNKHQLFVLNQKLEHFPHSEYTLQSQDSKLRVQNTLIHTDIHQQLSSEMEREGIVIFGGVSTALCGMQHPWPGTKSTLSQGLSLRSPSLEWVLSNITRTPCSPVFILLISTGDLQCHFNSYVCQYGEEKWEEKESFKKQKALGDSERCWYPC